MKETSRAVNTVHIDFLQKPQNLFPQFSVVFKRSKNTHNSISIVDFTSFLLDTFISFIE